MTTTPTRTEIKQIVDSLYQFNEDLLPGNTEFILEKAVSVLADYSVVLAEALIRMYRDHRGNLARLSPEKRLSFLITTAALEIGKDLDLTEDAR